MGWGWVVYRLAAVVTGCLTAPEAAAAGVGTDDGDVAAVADVLCRSWRSWTFFRDRGIVFSQRLTNSSSNT